MLDRELTYRMPFERLVKLSRMASRKAFSTSWWLLALFFALYVIAFALVIAFAAPIDAWLDRNGLPEFTPFVAIVAGFLLAIWWLRRLGLRQMQERADFDSEVRFRQHGEGLHFATPEVAYDVKWKGISQMMLPEKDGVVFSHGNLFFLVPNEAFRDIAERDALARDVFAKMTDKAQARSINFMPSRLIDSSTTGL